MNSEDNCDKYQRWARRLPQLFWWKLLWWKCCQRWARRLPRGGRLSGCSVSQTGFFLFIITMMMMMIHFDLKGLTMMVMIFAKLADLILKCIFCWWQSFCWEWRQWCWCSSAKSWWWEVLPRRRDHPNVRLQGRGTGSIQIIMKGPKRKTRVVKKSGSVQKWGKPKFYLFEGSSNENT